MQHLPDKSRISSELTVTTTSDTQDFAYPAGTGPGNFAPTGDHKVVGRNFSGLLAKQNHITISFLTAAIRVVNLTERTFREGDVIVLDLDLAGRDDDYDGADPTDMVFNLFPVQIDLGSPIASDGDGVVASQAATAAGGLATGINGALATDGVATLDVPRNVVAAWTNTAVLTVTGTDVDGNVMVESSGSGTSMTGKKAFKTVTGISVSADVTGLTVGTSKVLGIPVFLDAAIDVIAEIEDGAAPTAGTLVKGDEAIATATTGDVKGTYAPNGSPDGSKRFQLNVLVKSKTYKGVDQYAG
jgi:hypothetical protein